MRLLLIYQKLNSFITFYRRQAVCLLVLSLAILFCWNQSVSAEEKVETETKEETKQGNDLIAFDSFDYYYGVLQKASSGIGWKKAWKLSRKASPIIADFPVPPNNTNQITKERGIQIEGTQSRNNPLRRELKTPLKQNDIYVRFDLVYRNIPSQNEKVDPEFFVFWLDKFNNGDYATHSANVPNIGLHFADKGPKKGKNVFMVRIGADQTAWSRVEVKPDRVYQVVGRLSKTKEGNRADYDQFELWINPELSDLNTPDAVIKGAQSVNLVQWVGFSTGNKTEETDRIFVNHLRLGRTWNSLFENSALPQTAQNSPGHNGVVWNKTVDFKKDVYPLLESRCFDCHSGENPDSGYRLDVYKEITGYSTGEILAEPGKSHQSRLIKALHAKEEKRMPPDGEDPLTDEQIAMLRAWIDQGMKWDEELLPSQRVQSDHWAFQPFDKPAIPKVENSSRIRTPVDAFIIQMQKEKILSLAPEADRVTLIRRLYLDLTGIPPTPEKVQAFLNDQSEDAYEKLVEELLNSPHYGERWARYWLDLARWAESQGYQHDVVRPFAWRYRDYVIDSFNKDKPYNRFLKEQLAGDELKPYSDENVIATGFLGAARISGNQGDPDIQRNDVLVDIVNATGSVMLGLTLECAQCHNHKFDPLSQRDYYRMMGFFVKGQLGNLSLKEEKGHDPEEMKKWIPNASYKFYLKEIKTLKNRKKYNTPDQPYTWGFLSAATGHPEIKRFDVVNRIPIEWKPVVLKNTNPQLYLRGDVSNPGPVVKIGWPEVLGETPNSLGENSRSALADWMTNPENPLVSRVWVNRLWQYHFGRGIVNSPSDFGVKGEEPTHPELLDWLASELIDHGWSTKHIHRMIVNSSTYRQQRKHHPENAKTDPENRFLWNWPLRRLEAEAIRDSVLVATGELDRRVGGHSIPQEKEETVLRRTIYLFQQRSGMPTVMKMFDAPDGITSCSGRAVSTVALQPLFMLNSEFMTRRASALADLVISEAGPDPNEQIKDAFLRTLSRPPEDNELKMARKILEMKTDSSDQDEGHQNQVRLTQLCHALLNLNEFVYIP